MKWQHAGSPIPDIAIGCRVSGVPHAMHVHHQGKENPPSQGNLASAISGAGVNPAPTGSHMT
jgi:hypothetical protein